MRKGREGEREGGSQQIPNEKGVATYVYVLSWYFTVRTTHIWRPKWEEGDKAKENIKMREYDTDGAVQQSDILVDLNRMTQHGSLSSTSL